MGELSVVMVASFPPPIAGQSLAGAMLYEYLNASDVRVSKISLTRQFRLRYGSVWVALRALRVVLLPLQLCACVAMMKLRRRDPVFYLQVGQGRAALLRDLPLLLVAWLFGQPMVLHAHGQTFRSTLEQMPTGLRWVLRNLVMRAARVVVLSPSLKSEFSGIVPEERIVVVANGVEPCLSADASLRMRPNRGPVLSILFMGNLIRAKGYTVFLDAARLASDMSLPHRFIIAGARTEWTDVDPEVWIAERKLTNVSYRGVVTGQEKMDLLASADAIVLPSEHEGQPISLLEAMHYGMTLIATPVGGIRDLLADPAAGYQISPGNPAQVIEAVVDLSSSPERRARAWERNREAAALLHTQKENGKRLLDVLISARDDCRRTGKAKRRS